MTSHSRSLVDRKRAETHLLDLLAMEGTSGKEKAVAETVRSKLRAAGCRAGWMRHDDAHRRIGRGFETGNLIVRLPGTVRGPARLFCAHLDTVPLCRGAEPVRRGRRIVSKGKTGLGADNRTAVACLVTAAETILRGSLPHPPVTLLFTVGEEVGLQGARHARADDLGRPRLGFNVDGGDPSKITVGALGAVRWDAEVLGRSAHAGVHPDHGVSAALIAARAIAAASRRGWFGRIRKRGGRGTANVGSLHGGETTNQVTDRVEVRGESRSHDLAFAREITSHWRDAFREAAASVRNHRGTRGRVRFRARVDYRPFRLSPEAPVVRAAREAVAALGREPSLQIVDGGLDASMLNARRIPTVTLGAGQHSPHTVDEYVDLDEYLDGCGLVLGLATG